MIITLLGTNGWFDTETGQTMCTLIRTQDYSIILDAGFGIRKAKELIDFSKPTFLLLSHLHLDHTAGMHLMDYLNFRIPLKIIKIDKSILWEAEKSELGFIILENNIRMIHQMHLNILVEGVETEAQIKLLEPMGVNYLQGFFFSKPVPKDKFLKIVQESGTRSKA